MTNLFDALEFCLQELERGETVESVLVRFPEHADELRPILQTAREASKMASLEPSPEVVRRSRARVMQGAAELREAVVVPRRRSIPLFQRLALAFTLAAVFLLSGNGLLSASASALPGENLYPVKRGWENVRLFFIFDSEARALLENEFENERLHEANELLADGRDEVIDFAGVFMQVNGNTYVSGLQVILPVGMPLPADGDAVIVSGRTNAQGFVEVINIQLLPEGSVVPTGSPIEVESESDSGSDSDQPAAPVTGSGNEALNPKPQETRVTEAEFKGILQVVATTSLTVNGMVVYLDNSKIDGQLCIGDEVEVKGYYASDGRFIVLEAKGKDQCSSGSSSGSGYSGDSSSLNINDDKANSSNDGNSGSGGDDGSNSNDGSDDHGGGNDNGGSD